MSLILALDSSTDACSVALSLNGELFAIDEIAAKSHTQRLLPMVDELLQQANLGLDDLDAIAFGRGPGSFTGLRICMGIVQGLAFGAQLPVVPISTLAAMALAYYQGADAAVDRPVLVALDARMEEVYWGLFGYEAGHLVALTAEYVMRPDLLILHESLTELEGQLIGVGSGWHYEPMGALQPYAVFIDAQPSARAIVQLAAPIFAAGEASNILDAEPIYLRDTVSWQKRQRIRQ